MSHTTARDDRAQPGFEPVGAVEAARVRVQPPQALHAVTEPQPGRRRPCVYERAPPDRLAGDQRAHRRQNEIVTAGRTQLIEHPVRA